MAGVWGTKVRRLLERCENSVSRSTYPQGPFSRNGSAIFAANGRDQYGDVLRGDHRTNGRILRSDHRDLCQRRPCCDKFLFTIVGIKLVDTVGRRKLVLASLAGVTLSLGLIGASFYVNEMMSPFSTNTGAQACAETHVMRTVFRVL